MYWKIIRYNDDNIHYNISRMTGDGFEVNPSRWFSNIDVIRKRYYICGLLIRLFL